MAYLSHGRGRAGVRSWGKPLKLVRDNLEDPRVVRDLGLLAGATPDAVDELAAREASEAAAVAAFAAKFDQDIEPGAPTPFADPFVRRFVIGVAHIKRYLPFYLGGAAWLGVMILIQPFGKAPESVDQFASQPASLAPAASSAVETTTEETTIVESAPLAMPGDTIFDTFDATVLAPSEIPSNDSAALAVDEAASFDETEFASDDFEVEDEPKPLKIVKSGYASQTGGTALEQQPAAGGLPVAAANAENVKLSYIALTGDLSVLRLKEVPDTGANVNAESAVVKACPLTSADWEATRGAAMADAPEYETACATGTRSADGVWTFDLGDYGALADHPGFALVGGPGPTASFQITFAPAALPPVDAAEAEATADV